MNGTTVLSNVSYGPFGPAHGWTWGNGNAFSRAFDGDGDITGISTTGIYDKAREAAVPSTGPSSARSLAKLWMADVKRRRQGTLLTKSSQNRIMTALRAALNLAVQNRRVGADRAIEWKQVKQHSHAEGRRELFLDLDQRRRLIEAAHGAVRDLIAGIALTGARPGDLRMARRSHFDSRTGTISFYAKNHQRTIPLPLAALPLFERLAKDKLPNAWLFTRDDGKPWAHSDWDELVRAAAVSAGLQSGVCL